MRPVTVFLVLPFPNECHAIPGLTLGIQQIQDFLLKEDVPLGYLKHLGITFVLLLSVYEHEQVFATKFGLGQKGKREKKKM